MSSPAGPVMGFRRWRVTDDGKLMGLGLSEVWETAHQTAKCKGTRTAAVLEYCDEPEPESAMDAGLRLLTTYQRWAPSWYADPTEPERGRVYRLPDGKWAQLVNKMTCKDGLDPDHAAPSLTSLCGIWAHKQPVPDCTCPEPDADRHGAVGVVRMWGKAVEHEDGWRSEHAELVAVVDHSGRLRDYGVPVYATTAAMYAEWAPDADGWAARHDACWCDHGSWGGMWTLPPGSTIKFGPPVVVPNALVVQHMQKVQDMMRAASGHFTLTAQQMNALALASASATTKVDTVEVMRRAQALSDKQTRNADHPGQDRPEKRKRRRKL